MMWVRELFPVLIAFASLLIVIGSGIYGDGQNRGRLLTELRLLRLDVQEVKAETKEIRGNQLALIKNQSQALKQLEFNTKTLEKLDSRFTELLLKVDEHHRSALRLGAQAEVLDTK